MRAYSDYVPLEEQSSDKLNLQEKAGQGEAEERRLREIKDRWSSRDARRPSRRTEYGTAPRSRGRDEPTSQRMQNVRGRPKQLASVPFEGDTGSATPAERLQNTTMTPREMQVFEELFRKGIERKKAAQAETQQKAGGKKVSPRTVQFPELLRPLADEAERMRLQNTLSDAADNKTKKAKRIASLEIKDAQALAIKGLMDKATTEIELYQILQAEIFDRLRSTPSSEALQSNFPALPALLQHHMELSITKLPTTHSLGLLVLPELKKIGPLAFALGATTELYNSHMRLLWTQYRDMEQISSTLEEMDKEVYSFDEGTSELLRDILDHENRASKGQCGEAVKALWSMDRKRRGVGMMRRWKREVDERLRTRAVDEAREGQIRFDEEEEESGDSRAVAVAL